MTPLLTLLFGVSPTVAVGTDLAFASITKGAGTITHRFNGTVNWPIVRRLCIGALPAAFVATLGLPQVNPVNEQLRERMGAMFGAGYDYTYLYPGMQKVVQAAGRVIRTPEDRGSVHLIDDRFAGAQVAGLLPRWWRVVA